MIIDTDVLIWYMKGNEKAYKAIERADNFFISVVTYIELVQGMRNKKELNSLRKSIHSWNAKVLYISEEISSKAMFYVEQHFLSHSLPSPRLTSHNKCLSINLIPLRRTS